jgi:hypothetical protein
MEAEESLLELGIVSGYGPLHSAIVPTPMIEH